MHSGASAVPGLKHVVCRHATYASEALSWCIKKRPPLLFCCGFANVREFENTAMLSATVQPAGISATKTSMQGNGGPKRLLRRRSSPPTAAAILCVRPIIMKKKRPLLCGLMLGCCCWAPKAGLYRREAANIQEPWIIPRPHTHPPSHTQAARRTADSGAIKNAWRIPPPPDRARNPGRFSFVFFRVRRRFCPLLDQNTL